MQPRNEAKKHMPSKILPLVSGRVRRNTAQRRVAVVPILTPISRAKPPSPNPKSQSFSRSYGPNLPTSLTYIILSTRGCSPWRPDAVMSTTRGANKYPSPRFSRIVANAPNTSRSEMLYQPDVALSPGKLIPGRNRNKSC